jgi:hypothetical protein
MRLLPQASFPISFRSGPAFSGPSSFPGAARRAAGRILPGLVLLLATVLFPARSGAGERLYYDLSFGPIPVGSMVLETRRDQWAGRPATRATVEASSNAVIDLLLRVRNRYSAVCADSGPEAFHFLKEISEGKRQYVAELLLEEAPRASRYLVNGAAEQVLPLSGPALDPLSLLIALRREALYEGAVLERRVADGRREARAVARVGELEKVRGRAGTWEALRVDLDLGGAEGLFGIRERVFTVWAAPQAGNLPVQVRAWVRLGTWSGPLTARLAALAQTPD